MSLGISVDPIPKIDTIRGGMRGRQRSALDCSASLMMMIMMIKMMIFLDSTREDTGFCTE
jgi:hypothetical protein